MNQAVQWNGVAMKGSAANLHPSDESAHHPLVRRPPVLGTYPSGGAVQSGGVDRAPTSRGCRGHP